MGLFRSVDISFDVYTEKLTTGIDRLHDIWPGDIHKPYACVQLLVQCGKKFPSKRNLTRHIRVHTGENHMHVDSVDDKIDPTLICLPVLVYHNIFNFLHTVHLF